MTEQLKRRRSPPAGAAWMIMAAMAFASSNAPSAEPSPRGDAAATKAAAGVDAPLVEIKLPATVDDVAVGGGGRYLALWLGRVRQVALVDVAARKISKYIPVDDDQVALAAGATKLVIAQTSKGIVSRYDLATTKREATQVDSLGIRALTLGCASEGPILVGTQSEFRRAQFLDLVSLRPVELELTNQREFPRVARASADGRLIGGWERGVSPSGLHTLVVDRSTATYYNEHRSVGMVLPSYDGTMFFTQAGRYTPQAKSLEPEDSPPWQREIWLPAATGSLLLSIPVAAEPHREPARKGVRLLMQNDLSLIAELPEIEVPVLYRYRLDR